MLSNDLKRLQATFTAWSAGKPYPTPEDWHAFQRDLRLCVGKAMLLELGVDPAVFNLLATCAEPGSNVTMFPSHRQRRVVPNGGAV